MLREAGAEHGKALIVNTASISGKSGQPWLSVYSATKAGVVGFSQATQKEVANDGIQVTALCPGFVDTPMTEFVKEQVKAEEMIRPEDIAEAVRFLLRTSPACLVPEIVFTRPGEQLSWRLREPRSGSPRCSRTRLSALLLAAATALRRLRASGRRPAPAASPAARGARGGRRRGGLDRPATSRAPAARRAIARPARPRTQARLEVARSVRSSRRVARRGRLAPVKRSQARGEARRGWCGRRFGARRASGRSRRLRST